MNLSTAKSEPGEGKGRLTKGTEVPRGRSQRTGVSRGLQARGRAVRPGAGAGLLAVYDSDSRGRGLSCWSARAEVVLLTCGLGLAPSP